MISICIPVYNYDIRPTVERLAAQIAALPVEAEIICIDDSSAPAFQVTLPAPRQPILSTVQLPQNIGRARIRNLFLQHARYPWLLFLDCDSLIPDGFLMRYLQHLDGTPKVVCGGRVYSPRDNDRDHRLRYTYGIRCESKSAQQRSANPYNSFMTNNFVVHRDVLASIPFDSRISQYGHEDTLFGYRLMQQAVPIRHIDNPVVNGDVEDNPLFLSKTQQAVQSLVQIYLRLGDDQAFVSQVALLRFHRRVSNSHLLWTLRLAYPLLHTPLEKAFARGRLVNMKLFALYKLILFQHLLDNQR